MLCLILRKSELSDLERLTFSVAKLEPAVDCNNNPIFLATRSSVIIDDPRFSPEEIAYGDDLYFENISESDLIALKPSKH